MRLRGLAVLAFLLAASAYGQTPTSSLTGRVTIPGAFAANVTVTATSKSLQVARTTTTTQWGRYWLTALPPGQYEVTFSRPKHQTVSKNVVIELGRVARLDALLEPSEDEESITSTAKGLGVTDTTAITTHYSDDALDRLPYRRDPFTATLLSPDALALGRAAIVDDAPATAPGQEALEQVTEFRGALPADHDLVFPPPYPLARTRAGGEELFLALRADAFEGGETVFEGAVGGRIVPEKLWFFADGSDDGFLAKLTAQLGPQHSLTAMHLDTERFDETSVRYTGVAGPYSTTEAGASRYVSGTNTFFAKSTYLFSTEFGDHIVSAGGRLTRFKFDDDDTTSAFLNDRWVWGRTTMNLGLRHDFEHLGPRAAATFDLRNNGRHALVASLSDYTLDGEFIRELTAGYAMVVGNSGNARVDLIRRDYGDTATKGVEADFVYSLFDRFFTGATYGWQRIDADLDFSSSAHRANAWASVELPAGEHEFGITLVERFRSGAFGLDDEFATDLALRYSLPVRRTRLTAALDTTNVLDNDDPPFGAGRQFRGWIRLRM